ncbi:LssY C-terminal domain-containing protein [Pseudoclavibacter sp. VKM Ac-2888]|uniref:LssY C-terminal domain-containing protein n=1 Tax=Pseudoclavibacter sp. VKM Ac-2888 TaxID=2783830 RepID=UPI00188B8688|nr:LssY C-terminal domain-containing protein [Pseudoclavibacter sp. VKM Ac-2888]MBF4551404.1 LssY C-terminal domain-containing protein [Pseudoclavibacter sp. VKM Ac-2888]
MTVDVPRRRPLAAIGQALDGFFFVFAGLAAIWLAVLVADDSFQVGWWGILLLLAFWGLLAYLVLPRIHRILTTVYVPDYFIGRARTSDGLLGDPINLGLLGHEAELHDAMRAAGWTRADDISLRTSLGIISSTVTRRSYHEAPVSPLFLFGRQQDFAYQQEVAGNPAKRHHVRFWKCPDGWLLPGGTRVDWLAAGTFDRAVGFSLFTLQVTHKIDADTDIERDHIVATVLEGTPRASVAVLKDFSTGYHSRNGGGDSIRTDGNLPVLQLPSTSDAPLTVPEPVLLPSASGAPADRLESAPRDSTLPAPSAPSTKKRAAFEAMSTSSPIESSVAEEVRRHGRPITITFGAIVVFGRALLALLLFGVLALIGPDGMREVLTDAELSGTDATALAEPAWIASMVVGGIVVSSTLLLGILVLRGVNWARITLLLYAAGSIALQFGGWWAGDEEIRFSTTLAFTALDILSLLALSGKPARQYSRQRP